MPEARPLGIVAIASYIPEGRASNRDAAARFGTDEAFLRDKIGVLTRAVRGAGEEASDMALAALRRLLDRTKLAAAQVQALVVVTQNPDSNLPHVAALVHGRAQLAPECAAFDIGLGCSGYVYGLSILQAFLGANGLERGVLVTADPYSKVVDPQDRDTALLFGDAATATLVGPRPVLVCGPFTFGTSGEGAAALECRNGRLSMKGREVFNFAATAVPRDLDRLLGQAGLEKDQVDAWLLHQGSRYIVETLARRAGLPRERVRGGIEEIGNTVSSSIPLLLEKELCDPRARTLVLSGFGVGLSWSSCVCRRTENG